MRFASWYASGYTVDARHAPRPKFQHGVLPENPILVALRADWTGHENSPFYKSFWRDALISLPESTGSPAQIEHATRVISLLSKLT